MLRKSRLHSQGDGGTFDEGSQAQARGGGPRVPLPSLDLGGPGGSSLGWAALEVQLPPEARAVRTQRAWKLSERMSNLGSTSVCYAMLDKFVCSQGSICDSQLG